MADYTTYATVGSLERPRRRYNHGGVQGLTGGPTALRYRHGRVLAVLRLRG
ncbi:hypothetical protein AB4305_05825 [Nocardia sp. 2YAB30]|uniref:hypothetical protein n=1 Tax=unclassified Nocardia TaxID=2637762 RepID=UPI003F9C5A32